MPVTIDKDTTWSGRVVLSDDVQIAKDATLTIAAGTEIVGGGFDIVGAGNIRAVGGPKAPILFDDVYINPTDDDYDGGTLTFRNVEFAGATTIATSARVAITVADCVFNGTGYPVNLWEPENGSITGCVFLGSFGVSVSTVDDFEFRNNLVADQTIYEGSSYALESWGLGRVISTGNAFLAGDRVALRAGADGAVIDSLGDFFGGDPAALVDDRTDDPEQGDVVVRYPDPRPSGALERTLVTFTTLALPDKVIRSAMLVGDRDADLFGNVYSNFLAGNAGDNGIDGAGGFDTISGRDGDDEMTGGAGLDRIRGGDGNDVLDGGADDDVLYGNGGFDRLFGGGGDDNVVGSAGADTLSGGDGNDRIDGGGDNDVIVGGAGADTIVLAGRFGTDRMSDFDDGDSFAVRDYVRADVTVVTRDDDIVLTFKDGARLTLYGAEPVFEIADLVFA